MKRVLVCLSNNELSHKIFLELNDNNFLVEIDGAGVLDGTPNFDLLLVDLDSIKELEKIKTKLENKNTPVIVVFEKEILNTDIVETFKKGVVDITYVKPTNIKPLMDSINRFFEKEENLTFEQEVINGWNVIRIQSELNIKNAFKLKSIFDEMLKEGKIHHIFDLGKLSYMESVGLGVLIYIKKRIEEYHGEIKFIISSARIKKLITMVNLEKYFEIYDRLEDFLVNVEVTEKLSVAIIDDARFMRTLIASVLEEEGFHTVSYGNPVEALDELIKNPTDIILADYQIPEKNR